MSVTPRGDEQTAGVFHLGREEAEAAEQATALLADAAQAYVTTETGKRVPLPSAAVGLLRSALEGLSHGREVLVAPLEAEIGTQKAADILGVSRPFLVRLLDEGTIPHCRVGTHRRVRLEDVLSYRYRRRAEGEQAATELTELSQELGLY